MVGGLGTGMDDVRTEPAVAWFRVEPDRGQWRMCVSCQCEWKWMASTAASARDVAPRLERYLVGRTRTASTRRFLNERHVAEATSPGAGLYGRGEEHAETGATPRPVIDLDPTAMRQDDGLANRQPQPVTGHV